MCEQFKPTLKRCILVILLSAIYKQYRKLPNENGFGDKLNPKNIYFILIQTNYEIIKIKFALTLKNALNVKEIKTLCANNIVSSSVSKYVPHMKRSLTSRVVKYFHFLLMNVIDFRKTRL